MSTSKDYYELLQVSRDADDTTIKKSYRRLAMEYHPDRNPSEEASAKFREVSEAYEVLSDPDKKALYDQYGQAGLKGQQFHSASDVFAGFQSIFEDFFGADPFGGGGRRARRGRDLQYRMKLEFKEAVLGTSKTIDIDRLEICKRCEGSGCKPGSQPQTCGTCDGHGQVAMRKGFFTISQPCPHCQGEGETIVDPCPDCHGQKMVHNKAEIDVDIPAGVDTGVRLRLNGEGEPTPGGTRGDLYVEIKVKEDERFERDGVDLFTRVYVPYPTAALGGEITVPLIEGEDSLKVPAQMRSPTLKKIKHQGVADLRSKRRGDLYVELHIDMPEKLSSKAKDLIKQLDEELGVSEKQKSSPRADTTGDKERKPKFSFYSSFLS